MVNKKILVPDGWNRYKLSDLLQQDHYPVKMQDMTKYRLLSIRRRNGGFFEREWKMGQDILTKTLHQAKSNYFVISKMQAYHGAFSVTPEKFQDGMLSSSYVSYRLSDKVNPKFFNYLSYLPSFYQAVRLACHGVHVEKMTFNEKEWIKNEIVLPPLKEQEKISLILSRVDELIQKTEDVIEKTEKLKKEVLQQLLTKGIGHTKFKKTEIGNLPDSWLICTLDDIAPSDKPVVQTGPFGAQLKSEYFTDSGVPVLNIGNIQQGNLNCDKLDYLNQEKANDLKRYEVSAGDLLFSRMASVGRTAVVPPECDGWLISYHLMRLSLNRSKCNPYFLMYSFIGSPSLLKQVRTESAGGTRAGVNTSILKSFKFALPPIDEQNQIVRSLTDIDRKINTENLYKQSLGGTKTGLIQSLVTGKVRIKVDDGAEVTKV